MNEAKDNVQAPADETSSMDSPADAAEHTAIIDGEEVPYYASDVIEGRTYLHIDVHTAVRSGYTFNNIWGCKQVTVELGSESFVATVNGCSIEHGVAALCLTPQTPNKKASC